MTAPNAQTLINRDNARIAGVQKHCMSQTSILVAGTALTPASVIQIYQSDLDARQAVAAAKSALKAALAKADAAEAACATFDSPFKRCIEGAYEGQPDTLADFGITVTARTPLTAAEKAEAAEKAAATRAARHIMGKKQRSMIVAQDNATSTPTGPAPAPATAGTGAASGTPSASKS